MTSPTETMPSSSSPEVTGTLAIRRSLIRPITSSTSSSRLQVIGSRVITSQTGIRPKLSPRLWMTRSTSRSLKMPMSFLPWSTTGSDPMLCWTSLAIASPTVASQSIVTIRRPLDCNTSRTSIGLSP